MNIKNIRINGLSEPIGYYLESVHISWVMEATYLQKIKCQILVSLSKNFQNIIYQKEVLDHFENILLEITLKPRTRYFIRIIADDGENTIYEETYFETGKLQEKWKAKWIGTYEDNHPVMIKNFIIDKPVKNARLYIYGLGMYEAYLNGKKVGNEILTPYFHDYDTEYQYQTYDVTSMFIVNYTNNISILLGNGWYKGRFGMDGNEHLYGNEFALIAELHIQYENKESEIIITDETWNYKYSDIESDSIYDGEIYNHLLWDNVENNDKKVRLLSYDCNKLVERYSLPIIQKAQIDVQNVIKTSRGTYILDFGQNFAGYVQINTHLEKGTKICLRYGEVLQNNDFYNENYRSAKAEFVYVSSGNEEIVWPHFTYYGFRYVEVIGWSEPINKELFKGIVIYSDLKRTGYFECGHPQINQLYQNAFWGQCSNFVDIPTDCPQRDERLGWTGDTQVFAKTASYNMDTKAFYRKFLHDLSLEQNKLDGGIPNYFPNKGYLKGCSSIWGDAVTIIPEQLKRFYNNQEDYEKEYQMMKDWVDYLTKFCSQDYLINQTQQFGDWLALDGITEQSFRGGTDDLYLASIYYYHSTSILVEMSQLLEKPYQKEYKELQENIKTAILKEYFSLNGKLCIDTQAGYIAALYFGVYKDKNILIRDFLKRLRKDCYEIKCGFVGAPLLCQTLEKYNLQYLAMHFLLNENYPGWLYSVNLGATTIWERWNSLLPNGEVSGTGMNSFNHYAYGAIADFLYESVAGLKPTNQGFKKVVIKPILDIRVEQVRMKYESYMGDYVINWKIKEDGDVIFSCQIPYLCEADVYLDGYQKVIHLHAGEFHIQYHPSMDLRCIYNERTLINTLLNCKNARTIICDELPYLIDMAKNDKETQTLCLEDILNMPYLGFSRDKVCKTIERIKKVKYNEEI